MDNSFFDEVLRFFKPSTPQFYNSFMNRSISVLHRHQRMGCNDSVLQCAQHNFISRVAGMSKNLVGTSLSGGHNLLGPFLKQVFVFNRGDIQPWRAPDKEAWPNHFMLKFGLSEKHTKFEKIFLMVLTNQLIYLVNVKAMSKIFSNYVCFSISPNFSLGDYHVDQPKSEQIEFGTDCTRTNPQASRMFCV